MKLSNVLFSAFFVAILVIPGILQAVVEHKDDKNIQSLDLIRDIFATPFQKQAEIDSVINLADLKIDTLSSLGKDSEKTVKLSVALEDVARDIYNRQKKINTYLRADSAELVAPWQDFLDWTISFASKMDDGVFAEPSQAEKFQNEVLLAKKHVEKMREEKKSLIALIEQSIFSHTLFSQKYLRAWEKGIEDNSIIADSARNIMQYLRYKVMGDQGEKVVVGKDGWLFYNVGVDYLVRPYMDDPRNLKVDANDKALIDNPLECILHFQKQLAEMGTELLVVIVPGKATIYPEMVNDDYSSDDAAQFSHTRRFLDSLTKHGVDAVNLLDAFKDEKKSDVKAGDSLYLRMDTHWTLRALKRAAFEVSQKIKSYDWFADSTISPSEYLLKDTLIDREGDVAVMSQIPGLGYKGLAEEFPKQNVKAQQVFQIWRDSTNEIIREKLYSDDFRKARVLLLGDSFSRIYQTDAPLSAGWISHIAANLNENIASIVSDGGSSTRVREKLQRKQKVLKGKKLVVWEFVERDLRYGDGGWKNLDFSSAIESAQ